MKPTLQSTNNAELFVSNDEQRPLHPQHVRFLASSMTKHGFLPSKPIQCYRRSDGKYIVVDGHHRLEAAKSLGIMFYFVCETELSQEAMPDVNRSRQWKSEDFIRQYAMRGYKDYRTLCDYVRRGVPTRVCVSMLAGESAGSLNQYAKIKTGEFKVKTTKQADFVLSLIEDNPKVPAFRHSNFISALSLCLWLREFDFGTFKGRAERNAHMIPNCSNAQDFLTAIEEVYNHHRPMKDRVPLALNAAKAAKQRQCSFGK
jgi:hypothetical protein